MVIILLFLVIDFPKTPQKWSWSTEVGCFVDKFELQNLLKLFHTLEMWWFRNNTDVSRLELHSTGLRRSSQAAARCRVWSPACRQALVPECSDKLSWILRPFVGDWISLVLRLCSWRNQSRFSSQYWFKFKARELLYNHPKCFGTSQPLSAPSLERFDPCVSNQFNHLDPVIFAWV